MRLTRLAATAASAAVVLAACGGGEAALNVDEVVASAPVPVDDVPSVDPRLEPASWLGVAGWIARESAAGRPVVVNVFASWCAPCRAEAPLLRAAIDNHPGVSFLLVDHLDRLEEGRRFLQEEGLLDVPSVFDDIGDVAGALQARGMPATAFFSADGDLVGVVNGVLTEPVLAQRLADLEATAR